MRIIIKRIWNIITTILVCVALILAILLWGVRLLGMDIFVVQSGSMEPSYPVGSIVYVKETDVSQLRVGDVITFRMDSATRGTHRIIEVLNTEGQLSFRTKGDANEVADNAPVTADDVIGKVVFSIPELGYMVTYIQQPPGLYFGIAVIAVVLLLCILPDMLFPDNKEKKSEAEKR